MGASASVIQEYYKAVDYWADIACCYVKMVFLMKNFLLYQMCYLLNMLDMVITTIWSFLKLKILAIIKVSFIVCNLRYLII